MNHYLNIIRRHRNPLLWLNLLILTATILSATVLARTLSTPVWTARAKFNVPSSGGNLSADLGTLGSLKDSNTGFSREVNPLEIQSTIITSDAVMNQLWSSDPEQGNIPSLKSYKSLFMVEPQPQSTIMVLEAQGSSKELALARATKLTKVYQQRLNNLRYADADFRQEFSQKELKQAQDNLLKSQQELAEFSRTMGIVDSDSQTAQLVSSINELKTKLTLVQSEADAGQTRAQIVASQFKTTPDKAIQLLNLAENQEYQEIRQKLAQTELELSQIRSQYQESSPQIQNLLFKREKLSQELAQKVSSILPNISREEIDLTLGSNNSTKRLDLIAELIASQTTSKGLQQQTVQIQNQIDKLTSELNAISGNKGKLVELERKHNIAEGVYKGIVAQVNRAKIDNFNSYPNVQLIDDPILDPEPDKPSTKLILLGGVMASMFGSASLVLLRESSSPLLNPKDLKSLEFPVLFGMAHLKQPYLSCNSISASRDNYLAEKEFERLATIFRSLPLDNRRIMITSATMAEGKTTITLGLAIALKQLGFRVLVVDGDLQKAGLSNCLSFISDKPAVKSLEGNSPISLSNGLDIIPAPAVPSEQTAQYFARGDFDRYLDRIQAEGHYDYVLVDTPPVSLTSEAMLMSGSIENVLFVVRQGVSDRYSVMDSLEQLQLHQAQIKGLIVNSADSPSSNYRYGYQSQPQLPPALAARNQ